MARKEIRSFHLEASQTEALLALSCKTGVTQAEIVRTAIALLLARVDVGSPKTLWPLFKEVARARRLAEKDNP